MQAFVIGDSATSNSLGRAISMAITAEAAYPRVSLFALDDGPTWAGASQFGVPVSKFRPAGLKELQSRILDAGSSEGCLVWVSKCARPLDRLIDKISGAPGVVVLADFDDNDIAIMMSFRRQSKLNNLKMNRLRRKHPQSLLTSQTRAARRANGVTFSSHALADTYRPIIDSVEKPFAIVPHTRRAQERSARMHPTSRDQLKLGFVGTIRAHKGSQHLVNLMRADRTLSIVTFEQKWSPPSDCAGQWVTHNPGAPLAEVYEGLDYLVLPMSPTDRASLDQLPAKFIDAASLDCPVAATPTPPLVEYADGAFLAITDWDATDEVLRELRGADRAHLAQNIGEVFDRKFSPAATGGQLSNIVADLQKVSADE